MSTQTLQRGQPFSARLGLRPDAGAGHDQLHGPSALGVVAQAVRGEFSLSPVQMGYLFSSFLWTYVICLLPVGIMLDRFSPRNINSVGITLWSLAMLATAGVGVLPRSDHAAVMGAGEATSIPSCGRIVREWMPAQERGVAWWFSAPAVFSGRRSAP